MDGVTVSARHLHNLRVKVTADADGIYIACDDTMDLSQWIFVNITAAALWRLVNATQSANFSAVAGDGLPMMMDDLVLPTDDFPPVPPLT